MNIVMDTAQSRAPSSEPQTLSHKPKLEPFHLHAKTGRHVRGSLNPPGTTGPLQVGPIEPVWLLLVKGTGSQKRADF